uniref:CMP/dCMP-type deaminase domain-containing protein n=1 Tax=Suricata suricatta TaxID=37032 RepID=A0A673UD05_SURSU
MFTGLQNTHSQDKLLTIQDPDTFLFHFPNLRYANGRRLCYLCFQVERDHCSCDDGDWGVFRNKPAQHAEVRLLKRIQSWELGSELPYEVTCFQSWSPCCNCAKQLARFLEENKHVTLSIFASRLHTMEDYEEGLRILRSAGAHIAIMTSQGQCRPPGKGRGRERAHWRGVRATRGVRKGQETVGMQGRRGGLERRGIGLAGIPG